MALSKIQSESINLADNFAFTGTVTGAGESNSPLVLLKGNGNSQSVTNNSFVTLTFWTAESDTDSMYASNKITIPSGKGGKYLITAQTKIETADDINEVVMRIRTNNNGTDFMYFTHRSTYRDTFGMTAVRDLSAGDNLTLDVYHSHNQAENFDGDAYKSFWSVTRMKS